MLFKRIFFIFCCLLSCMAGFAQQPHQYFVYVQSESGKPFYVRANGELLSGSASGYIIIPHLKEGTNDLVIGFPRNEFPEQHFSIRLSDNKDEGYLLRNGGNGRFNLYNLQSFQTIRALTAGTEESPAPVANETSAAPPVKDTQAVASASVPAPVRDTVSSSGAGVSDTLPVAAKSQNAQGDNGAFASMLNKVTNNGKATNAGSPGADSAVAHPDSVHSVRVNPSVSSTMPPLTKVAPVDSSGNAGAQQSVAESDTATQRVEPIGNGETEKQQRKSRYHAVAKDQPQFITFLPGGDTTSTTSAVTKTGDTISNTPQPSKTGDTTSNTPQPSKTGDTASRSVQADNTGDTTQGAVTETSRERHHRKHQETEVTDTTGNTVAAPADHSPAMVNSDCGSTADEKEFQKTRRRIAIQKDDAGMLREANKYFASTCYSAAQVQSIAYLFMTDEYRYKFLDMAYAHTYDADNFPKLEKVLSDPYYVGRFRAMIRK